MRYLRILKDWNLGSSSNIDHRLLEGNIYNCQNEVLAAKLIAEGVAVEVSFGWIPQKEDARDYTINFGLLPGLQATIPVSCDLRPGCNPIVDDQGSLGSCTANAAKGIMDYMEKKQGHAFLNGSRLYTYYQTRVKIEGSPANQDTGCTIRGTMQSLITYGMCLESTWPYIIFKFSIAPTAAMLAEGANYQALFYALLDPANTAATTILVNAKNMLAAGYPFEFGFRVYSSFMNTKADGLVSYPKAGEQLLGGHAVLAVGYNDTIRCPNTNSSGAFLVRNSWGPTWGLSGYFWLPYEFITRTYNGQRLLSDMWALGKVEWMNV
jgi:C1A family cysteine protease